MIEYEDEEGNIVQRHDKNSYTVADLRAILDLVADDDDEVLVCIGRGTSQDEQIFPDKGRGSIYSDKDLLIIEVADD